MNQSSRVTKVSDAQVMPLQEALSRYQLPAVSTLMLEGIAGNVFVFSEDARFESLDIDRLFGINGHCGAIFLKSLQVDSYMLQEEIDYGPFVYVLGDVVAQNIVMGGGYIHFQGNVTVEQTLLAGFYNHGISVIGGSIDAGLIMSYDHAFDFKKANLKKGIFLSDNTPDTIPLHDPADVLNKGFWDKEDNRLLTDKVLKAIRTGKPILKAGAGATSPVQKRLDKARASKNKRADLAKMKLKDVPQELFELADLQQLNLSGNALQKISDGLPSLQHLKVLEVSECELKAVPDVVGRISSLEELDLSNNVISSLPASFVELVNLKKLSLCQCCFAQVPEVLMQLPKLEILKVDYQGIDELLSIDGGFENLKELSFSGDLNVALPKLERLHWRRQNLRVLPDVLMACTKLKTLDILSARRLQGLPNGIVALKSLEDVGVFIHEGFENVNLLTQLPKLKTIRVKYQGEIIPEQFYQVLDVPQWTALYIDGALDDNSILERILRRPDLAKLFRVTSYGDEAVDIAEGRRWLGIEI